MSTRKIELSVGAVKYVDPNEIITEEEYNYIKNKVPELNGRVGDIENEIEEINSSLDNKALKTFVNVKEFITDGISITKAIQNAIDTIVDGGTLHFPNGVYTLNELSKCEKFYPYGGSMAEHSRYLYINKNINITSDNAKLVGERLQASTILLHIDSCKVNISNLEFDVNNKEKVFSNIILVEGTKDKKASINITNCKLNGGYHQVELYDYVENSDFTNNIFDNREGYGGTGIHTTDCRCCKNITIEKNKFLGSKVSDAIEFNNDTLTTRNCDTNKEIFREGENTKNIFIRDNFITGYTGENGSTSYKGGIGIGFAGKSENVHICNNIINNIGLDGIHFEHSRYGTNERVNNIIIDGNIIGNVGNNCIALYTANEEGETHIEPINLIVSKNNLSLHDGDKLNKGINVNTGSIVKIIDNNINGDNANTCGCYISNVNNVIVKNNNIDNVKHAFYVLKQENDKTINFIGNSVNSCDTAYSFDCNNNRRQGNITISSNIYINNTNIIKNTSDTIIGLVGTNEVHNTCNVYDKVIYKSDGSIKTLSINYFDNTNRANNFNFNSSVDSYVESGSIVSYKTTEGITLRIVNESGMLYSPSSTIDCICVNGSNKLTYSSLGDFRIGHAVTSSEGKTDGTCIIKHIDFKNKIITLDKNIIGESGTITLSFKRATFY